MLCGADSDLISQSARILSPLLGGYGTRCARYSMFIGCASRALSPNASSWEKLHQGRTNGFCHRKRNALPEVDYAAEFWVRGREIGHFLALHQMKLIWQRTLPHVPARLEVIGSGAALAAAKVKPPDAALAGVFKEFPVHEIVRSKVTPLQRGTTVVRQNPVAEAEAHDRGNRRLLFTHHHDLRVFSEFFQNDPEELFREHRGAQIANALRVNFVKLIQPVTSDDRGQAGLLTFANHVTGVSWQGFEQTVMVRINFRIEGDVKVLCYKVRNASTFAQPQLQIFDLGLMSKRTCSRSKLAAGILVIGADPTIDSEGA